MKKFVAVLLIPSFVLAEPGQVTRYLMNEPASLFDVGMVRVQALSTWAEGQVRAAWMSGAELKPIDAGIEVYYSPESDRIYITISAMEESGTYVQLQKGCKRALDQLGIVMARNLPELFQHVGQQVPSEPSAFRATLPEIVELRCYVSGRDSSVGRFWASQQLDTNEMTVGKWVR
jgi:hypothetical protein